MNEAARMTNYAARIELLTCHSRELKNLYMCDCVFVWMESH